MQHSIIDAALAAANGGILVTDMSDVLVRVNDWVLAYLEKDAAQLHGVTFGDAMVRFLSPLLRDPVPLLQWLEMTKVLMDFTSYSSPERNACEVERNDTGTYITISGVPLVDKEGRRIGSLYQMDDTTLVRRTESILEVVSEAAKEINADLRISAIMPNLFRVLKERIPLDAMAVLSRKPNGRTVVQGALPEDFLGGPGAETSIVLTGDIGEVLIDIISDIGASADASPYWPKRPLLPETVLRDLRKSGMASVMSLPLVLPDSPAGLWVLASRLPRSYNYGDMAFLGPVSGHLAAATKNAALLETTREMYAASVRALAATVDIRDSFTMHHSEHVSMIAGVVAREMGLPQEQVDLVELAGLVHDIGKIGIPDSIMMKPGPLTPSEQTVMTNHSMLGAAILERAGMLADLAPLVLHHHEWYNGSGYPARLRGDDIPLGAAILAVADAFDTMVSDRPYRAGMPLGDAREEIVRCAGSQFHPEVAAALDRAIEKALYQPEGWLWRMVGNASRLSVKKERGDAPKTLVEQAGLAINSKELRVLFRIAQEMRKLLDLDEILDHIINIVAQEMGYANCVILIPDEGGENLVGKAGAGLSESGVGMVLPRNSGVSWWVMEHGIPQNIPDVNADQRYVRWSGGINSEFYVPLEVRGRMLGVLIVQHTEKGGFWTSDERMLMAVAGHIASALEVAQLHEQVRRAADRDVLTDLYNRRVFLHTLESSIQTASHPRSTDAVSVVIMDVDDLKKVNDTYGHLAGDSVLSKIAASLKKGFGAPNVVARYGGDEFVALLPGSDREETSDRMARVESGWMKQSVQDGKGECVPLPGVSYGVATYPYDGSDARALLSVADDRLRRTKAGKLSRGY